VDLVVTDLMMPRVNGMEVIAVLARHRPELPVLVVTGFAAMGFREAAAAY
jgi:CheY-like chemotaxis protein